MTPYFQPQLVNPPFHDPGLYLDFLFARRAILFDLGEIRALAARKILRVSDVFISHTHIDHFIGFDHMLRLMLGRDKTLRLYGPPGFLRQVEARLASYSWNLLGTYPTEFVVEAYELGPERTARSARFSSRRTFEREPLGEVALVDNVILEEENFLVRCAFLEHSIPCLAYAFEEKLHVNVQKNRLAEMGLPVGAWLAQVKRAIVAGMPGETEVAVPVGGEMRRLTLKELGPALEVVRGEKVAYVTDVSYAPQNREKIVALALGADYLFIEATFRAGEEQRARERAHLTTRQAGELARAAGVGRVIPFHFSPRHEKEEAEMRREVNDAFSNEPCAMSG
ncbi:ribonuclease Z [Geomesophilobacter sediminis]|uniref:Ribonuclease Z n=1 Tax=Geomesophilobacter sediminis TaxID=2798584 RepID=A0A8J7JCQ8_9BACT|nr:MBL fold metallo-hydrolase [Geomesophilobacter sediminis]MBJ6724673.1 ribonuclease Z [Geomesophilobacter sediminis]